MSNESSLRFKLALASSFTPFMVHKITALGRRGGRLFANLLKLLQGYPLTPPSLASMTLDQDDVDLALSWLRQPTHWGEADWGARYAAEFARWNGSQYAFAFMGGRVALSACIYALGLQPGDEVIVPGYTCVVVPNAFRYAQVKIIYSDIELETYGLDVEALASRITPRTRAILIHHLYGLVCRDYMAVLELARQRALWVIEDCAHATGAEYNGRKVGNYGDIAFYSSEQSKIFNTMQGGLAVTNRPEFASRLEAYYHQALYPEAERIERLLYMVGLSYYQFKHPQRWWRGPVATWQHGAKRLASTTPQEEQGIRPSYYGQKMAAPLAALGLNQIKKIDAYNARRRETAHRWDAWCQAHHYRPPAVVAQSTPVYLRYPVLVAPEKKQNRDWALREPGVALGVWFTSHLHPVPHPPLPECPNATRAVQQCVNFPCLLDS